MKRKWKVLITAGALIVLLGVAFARRDAIPDPIHNGKPVSEWVRACIEKPDQTFGTHEPTFAPIKDIGADAVPFLVRATEGHNGFKASGFYNGLHKKMPGAIRARLPAPLDGELIRIRAYWVLGALGSVARPSVPALARQFNANNTLLDFVGHTLSELGPDAKEAIPALTNAFHGPEGQLRWRAGMALAKVDPDYPGLLPQLVADLKSTNVISRRFASFTLGDLGPRAKPSLPALKEAENDSDTTVRARAAEALKQIGP